MCTFESFIMIQMLFISSMYTVNHANETNKPNKRNSLAVNISQHNDLTIPNTRKKPAMRE